MRKPFFTAANASMYAKKSHAADSARHKKKLADIADSSVLHETAEHSDPFAVELKRAMEETLKELREADNAKDRACCAQALKNLRETYHLVTGQAKPGVLKSGRSAPRSRDIVPQIVALPTPTNSVPSEKPVEPDHKSTEVVPPQ